MAVINLAGAQVNRGLHRTHVGGLLALVKPAPSSLAVLGVRPPRAPPPSPPTVLRSLSGAARARRCPATPRCPLGWMPPGSEREPSPQRGDLPPADHAPCASNWPLNATSRCSRSRARSATLAAFASTAGLRPASSPSPAETCDSCHDVDHSDPGRHAAARHGCPARSAPSAALGASTSDRRQGGACHHPPAEPPASPRQAPTSKYPVRPVPRADRRARAGHARSASSRMCQGCLTCHMP